MDKIQKPDRNQAKDITSRVEGLIKNAKSIISDYEKNCRAALKPYQSIKIELVQSTLQNIPIERLNDIGKGFRLATFRNAGIMNIYQLLKMSEKSLISIKGVGIITARQAKAAASSIERSVQEDTGFRINPDKKSASETELVKILYRIRHIKPYSDVSKKVIDTNLSPLESDIKFARVARIKIRWIFSFQSTKEKAINSVNQLNNFLSSSTAEELSEVISNYKFKDSTIKNDQAWEDFISHPADYYSLLEIIAKAKVDIKRSRGDLPQELVERVEAQELNHSLLKSSLRGYQEFGAKYAIVQQNVLLGDEMGLGKTVEAIAAMSHLQAEGSKYFVVVCPASVLINWYKEIVKHSKLNPYKIHGSDKEEAFEEWIKEGGVAVTTYETLKKLELPAKLKLDFVVADEAHYAKNPSAQRTQALYKFTKRSDRVLFMTGTPIENRVDEMLSLINCLQPDIAKNLKTKNYIPDVHQFRYSIAPVYLRRNQEDVLNELPELIQIDEWVPFGSSEKNCYLEAVKEGEFMSMRQAAWKGGSAANSPKLNRLLEICEDAKENNRKVIVFSFFRGVISTVKDSLGSTSLEPITGSVSPSRRQQLVDEFTDAPAGTILICQIQAGGVGLNIQAASVVIFCEPQIKPALESQAIARAYRMGQINRVVVHRLLSENSVDERMMELLNNKQRIFDSYARDSVVVESSLEAIDTTEKSLIDRIVAEEKKRLNLG